MYIYINGEPWKILLVSSNDPILYIEKNKYTLGVTVPEWHRIYICRHLREDVFYNVLYHELTHAEFASRGLFLPEYIEECLADITADNMSNIVNLF